MHLNTVHTSVTAGRQHPSCVKEEETMLAWDLQRAATILHPNPSSQWRAPSPVCQHGQMAKGKKGWAIKERERRTETEYYHTRTAHGVTAAHTFVLSGVQKCVRKEACWMYTNSEFIWAQLNKWTEISLSACVIKQPTHAEEASFHGPHRWNPLASVAAMKRRKWVAGSVF